MSIETTGLENRIIDRRGLMLVLSSPSGAGKTTLTRLLREEEPSLSLSISMTTRQRRPSEVEGVHYHFIDKDQFIAMRDRGEFLEWAEVHGNFYGSPKKPIEQSLTAGKDILFDIDYQGAQQVRANAPDDVVSVFIEHNGKILLLHRQDHKPQGNTWAMLAGKVDKSDDSLYSTPLFEKQKRKLV